MMKSNWKPKLFCRWFGCNFKETEHFVAIAPGLPICLPLERCARCGCVVHVTIFWPRVLTPQKFEEFLAVKAGLKDGTVAALRR